MAISIISFLFFFSISLVASSRTIVQDFHRKANASRRELSNQFSCGTGNLIDDCWRCEDNWENNRQKLADCVVGYGKNTVGGKNGKIYVVTDPSDDDVVNPTPGTIRHAVIQVEPLWIIFSKDMTVTLKEELIMNSYKTIDGRGFRVKFTGHSGITVQLVHNVIIHGITITGMTPSGNTNVRSTPDHFGFRAESDGDAISIFTSENVWVDHCTLSACADGLVDVVEGSTGVTISNNHFSRHNEVMLFGHSDDYTLDTKMRVSVLYNVFGEGLTQRMPRCRHGIFEVINNYYQNGWEMYAIGGTAGPTIYSNGNVYVAPNDPNKKEVTFHHGEASNVWAGFTWRSENDIMLNGAFFTPSGSSNAETLSTNPNSASQVQSITSNAGVMK